MSCVLSEQHTLQLTHYRNVIVRRLLDVYCCLFSSKYFERRMDPADLASLRMCEKANCDYAVTNGLKDVKDILHLMSNHLASIHLFSQSEGSTGATKSKASIPMLEENITETQWPPWKARFHWLRPMWCRTILSPFSTRTSYLSSLYHLIRGTLYKF